MKYEFDFASVLEQWPLLLEGAWTTVQLSFLATVLGFVLGALCAVGRGSRHGWLRRLVGAYVEAIRNTPLLNPELLSDLRAVVGRRHHAHHGGCGAGAGYQHRRLYLRNPARGHRVHPWRSDRGG